MSILIPRLSACVALFLKEKDKALQFPASMPVFQLMRESKGKLYRPQSDPIHNFFFHYRSIHKLLGQSDLECVCTSVLLEPLVCLLYNRREFPLYLTDILKVHLI